MRLARPGCSIMIILLLIQAAAGHPGGHGPDVTGPVAARQAGMADGWIWLIALSLFTPFVLRLTGYGSRLFASSAGLGFAVLASAVACGGNTPRPKGEKPAMLEHFSPFKKSLELDWDGDHLLVGSRAFPSHPLMVGITAWQQQVPLPQPYTGRNAWRIPLFPRQAAKPLSTRDNLMRGAIALAVNGVPIFNALSNRGEDAFLAGELDEFGGHCGRGDDYHYHTAPLHLEKMVGPGKPIAYALDGYPLMGLTDAAGRAPDDLDPCHGRIDADGQYRYYASKKYPYTIGAMRGEVTVRGDQIDPQPRDRPARPAGKPLRGATITAFERNEAKKTYTLTYTLRGDELQVRYTLQPGGTVDFVFTDAAGKTRQESYRRGR